MPFRGSSQCSSVHDRPPSRAAADTDGTYAACCNAALPGQTTTKAWTLRCPEGPAQAEQVPPALRRDEEREPRARGEGQGADGIKELRRTTGQDRHGDRRQPRHRQGHRPRARPAGATDYLTGRTTDSAASPWPGTITQTTRTVTRAGGHGIAVRVDQQVTALFDRVWAEQGQQRGLEPRAPT